MPTDKIGVYARFFEYANFRLPLSTFLVDMLRYYHIHISQLSVIGAAIVSHFEVLCRVHGFEPTVRLFCCFYVNSKNKGWMSFSKRLGNDSVCYTKPLDSLKNRNDRFFWVDSFTCPAFFPWNTSKGVPKDPFPKSSKFNAEHYAILVAHPAPFHKYLEPFLCLVGISRYYTLDVDTYPEFLRDGDEEMDMLSFIRTADPMKVRVGERQHANGEPRLLETTIGRVVPLLPVEQGDSTGGGKCVDIQPVIAAADTIVEDVAPLQPMRRKKRKTVAVDASGPSHPPKKLREDYGDPSGPSAAGKPRSAVQRLLAGAVLNAEVRGEPIPTLPFVTSSVSATPECENENPADSVTGPNLRTISAPQRFVISSDSSQHFGANIAEAEVDSIVKSSTPIIATVMTATVDAAATAKETHVRPSLFGVGSSSGGGTDPTPGGFSDVSGSDFLIGGIRTVVEPDFDLQKIYVPQWSVTNGSRLNDGRVYHEMVGEFAPPMFFASIREMEHDQLFTEFNVGAVRQVSLSAEVRMRAEYNIKEKRKLQAVVEEKDILLKAKGEEVDSLKAQLLVKEAEAAEAICLRAEASKFEAVEKSLRDEVESLKERKITFEKEKSVLDVRISDLAATVKVREQEAADSDAMVTAVKLQNDKIADQEWPSVELLRKGCKMALRLVSSMGPHGRSLEDLVAYNPSAEEDYNAALQELRSVDFSLLVELKSQKDASVETIMNLLCLESPLVDAPGMSNLQPDVDQLMVPIHRSEDQAVLGAVGTSNVLPAAVATITALSTTFAFASTVPSVSVDDYIIADEENVQLNVEEEKQGKGEGSIAGMVEVEFERRS
ncbi:hypothetical protein Tco_0751280 [Tanacetum coccineum]|uniref:Transposase (putative) gypsy type domain-containing protein n=1 Tax=Tanacetum coccineum TaxID=301880 RepID=A0ABQ4Z3L0_9ASTR